MNKELLKRWSFAGLCLMAMATAPISRADEMCPQQCQSCPGYARTGCHECCLEPVVKWAVCCNYYWLPPDYGWNSPVKVPVVRQGVTYYRYHPEHWYGDSSPAAGEYRSYPMVYSPTDTTQLGYTYQQVPYWQPAPHRLPPPPVPSQWHVRESHRGYNGRWHSSYTPIHHHQAANMQYWVEPMGNRPMMSAPAMMPTQPAGPVACPPAPEPTAAPKKLVPEPAAPAPPADAKSATLGKPRLTSMLSKLGRTAD